MVASYFQNVGTRADLQGKPFLAIESQKQDQPGYASECSTNGSDNASSDSEAECGIIDETVVKVRGEFMCPHCRVDFPSADALDQHDQCMDMPSDVEGAVGVNINGKFQCPDCNQTFDSEKALILHSKFIHDGAVFNDGYTLVYEFDKSERSKVNA